MTPLKGENKRKCATFSASGTACFPPLKPVCRSHASSGQAAPYVSLTADGKPFTCAFSVRGKPSGKP